MKNRNILILLAALLWMTYLAKMILLNDWGLDFFILIANRLWMLAQFVVFVFLCSLLGLRLLKESKFESFLERWIYSAGLGLGILSYFIFFCGLSGFLRFETVFVFILICVLLSYSEFRNIFHAVSEQRQQENKISGWSLLLLACLVLTALFYLIGAFASIIDYDAMEYHVAIPDLYAKAGRIYPLNQNVYSHFPFNTEMLYLAALLIGKMPFIKLFNCFFIFLTCGLIYCSVRKITGRFEALFASTVYLCSNHLAIVSWMAKSDAALQFYCAAAFFLALNLEKYKFWLVGVFAGLALGTKATAFIFIYGALSLVVFGQSLKQKNYMKALSRTALFILLAALFVLPYWIKNYFETGDPIFPLGEAFLKSSLWTSIQYEQWWVYHHAKTAQSVLGFLNSIGDSISGRENFWPTAYFALPCMLASFRQTCMKSILLYSGAGFVLCYFATIGDPRFLLPIFPVLAVGAGLGLFFVQENVPLRRMTIAASLLLVFWNMGSMAVSLEVLKAPKAFLGLFSRTEYLKEMLTHYPGIEFLNRTMKPGEKVLFLGEARTLYLNREAVAATVFDQAGICDYFLKESDLGETYKDLKLKKIRYILINPAEIDRWTRGVPGWSGNLSWEQVQTFVSQFGILIFHDPRSGIRIYQLKENEVHGK